MSDYMHSVVCVHNERKSLISTVPILMEYTIPNVYFNITYDCVTVITGTPE